MGGGPCIVKGSLIGRLIGILVKVVLVGDFNNGGGPAPVTTMIMLLTNR